MRIKIKTVIKRRRTFENISIVCSRFLQWNDKSNFAFQSQRADS